MIGMIFEKVILKIVQRHIEERGLLNASQFGFHARHSTALQCMRLTDHMATITFNNSMSMAAVFLDIEKAFEKIWHRAVLYKVSRLIFWISAINLITSSFSQRKFRIHYSALLVSWVPQTL
jgi:hypothetical protein